MRNAAWIALAVMLTTQTAAARPASTGPYAEVGIGGSGMLGDAQTYSATGLHFALRAGLDLFSWLSVGAFASAGTHEATVPAPPEGELYQLYSGGGELAMGFSAGPVHVFASGDVGGAYMSTNVLEKVMILDPGERWSVQFGAGGGVEYQLQNRHYAFGVAGRWAMAPAFDAMQWVSVRGYLRYTY